MHVDEHIMEIPGLASHSMSETCKQMLMEDKYRLCSLVDRRNTPVDYHNEDGSIDRWVPFCDSIVSDTQEHPFTGYQTKLNVTEKAICAKCCVLSQFCVSPEKVLDSWQRPRTGQQILDLMNMVHSIDEWHQHKTRFRAPVRSAVEPLINAQSFVDLPFGIRTDLSHMTLNSIGQILGLFPDKKLLTPALRTKMFRMIQSITSKYQLCKAKLDHKKHFCGTMIFKKLTIKQTEGILVEIYFTSLFMKPRFALSNSSRCHLC